MELFGFLAIFIIAGVLIERGVRKWLGVEKKRISETSGKNFDRRGRTLIMILFLCMLPFTLEKDAVTVKWFWASFLIATLGFQAFVQWRYLKNSKEYIITLILLLLGLLFFLGIDYFYAI